MEIFVTSLAIFKAQWTWMHPYHDIEVIKNAETAIAVIDYVNGPSSIWLRIETFAYYSYIGAAVLYILWM